MMFKNVDQKFIAGGLILLAWGGLVVAGLAPAPEFVSTLRDTLVGLGIYKAVITNPTNPVTQ